MLPQRSHVHFPSAATNALVLQPGALAVTRHVEQVGSAVHASVSSTHALAAHRRQVIPSQPPAQSAHSPQEHASATSKASSPKQSRVKCSKHVAHFVWPAHVAYGPPHFALAHAWHWSEASRDASATVDGAAGRPRAPPSGAGVVEVLAAGGWSLPHARKTTTDTPTANEHHQNRRIRIADW